MLAELVLLACVGFTGQKCSASYPMTECGFRQAMNDAASAEGRVLIRASGAIFITGDFCSTEEWRHAIASEPERWLPWNRQRLEIGSDFKIILRPILRATPFISISSRKVNIKVESVHFEQARRTQ